MTNNPHHKTTANWVDDLKVQFFRLAISAKVPATWFEKRMPPYDARAKKQGILSLEIVSHCWQYSQMLRYQLSSLILHPPERCIVTMTVYYSEDDLDTKALLDYFTTQNVPSVKWNWQPLHKYNLFRRSIGRNHAALHTTADWIWFTDCDLLFHQNCLDALSEQLQGRQDPLLFPRVENTTELLSDDDALLDYAAQRVQVLDIPVDKFYSKQRTRATGPLQITHGDVARALGYCDAIKVFQKPSRTWCKAHEDRVFRWLLGTQGIALDVPGVFRIRHISKGRYAPHSISSLIRRKIRIIQAALYGK